MRAFKNKYDLDLMAKELAMNKNKLNKEKEDLMDIEIKLKLKQDLLTQLQAELNQQEKYITVSKAITDDALWASIAGNRQIPDSDRKKLTSQIINPIYQEKKNYKAQSELLSGISFQLVG